MGEQAFEEWKQREIYRCKRDKLEKDAMNEQAKHTQSCTTCKKVQIQFSKPNYEEKAPKERSKIKFLQKYYHKGGFYQADVDDKSGTAGTDPIYQRDYWVPTTADNFDKTLLPVIMQVKNFGRRGRTKWSHLVAEDTSKMGGLPSNLMNCT